jgi:hypothetical protein
MSTPVDIQVTRTQESGDEDRRRFWRLVVRIAEGSAGYSSACVALPSGQCAAVLVLDADEAARIAAHKQEQDAARRVTAAVTCREVADPIADALVAAGYGQEGDR